jgi:hypothetical protein
VFGSCGFLSFSSVFCLFGGRLEASLYIHFIWSWVKSTRRSSAHREGKDEEKRRKRTPFFAVLIADCGAVGVPGFGLRRRRLDAAETEAGAVA